MGEKKIRIGLVIDYLASEYSENLLRGISFFCKERNIDLIVFAIGEIKGNSSQTYNYQYVAITSQIKKENIDGIVIASGTQMHGMSKKEFLSYLRSYKMLPIVNISMELSGIPSVIVDCDKAFDTLIQYLISEQGCRKFALLGVNSNSYDVKKRTSIFKNVLERNDISLKSTVFWKSNFEYKESYEVLETYYKKNKTFDFDAIVALNDDMAFACMDFCQKKLNLNIPDDIIITGFDDLRRSSFSIPTLTSVNQQVDFQSYKAAKILFDLIQGNPVSMKEVITARTILRQSTNRNYSKISSNYNTSYISSEIKEKKFFDDNIDEVSEWYTRRSQLIEAAHFYSGMHYDIDLQRAGKILTKELQTFGFTSFAIVVYEKPVEMILPFEYFNPPNNAILIGGFDSVTGFNIEKCKEEICFNPNSFILPENYFSNSSDGMFAMALYQTTIQYGYIVIKRQQFDLGVYDLITKSVSNQIATSFAFSRLQKERSVIRDRYTQLDMIAHTDELTGLKNRRGFMDLGQATMNYSEAVGQSGLIIYCDMDGLKKINDNYGHDAGDRAIKAQGQILQKNFRSNDIVARLGGDEFCIISPGLKSEDFDFIKQNIVNDCRFWTSCSNSPFELSISLGFIEYPDIQIGFNLSRLLADADSSLYVEKRRKKAEKLAEEKNKKR